MFLLQLFQLKVIKNKNHGNKNHVFQEQLNSININQKYL